MTIDLNQIKRRLVVMREVQQELHDRGGRLNGIQQLDDIESLIAEVERCHEVILGAQEIFDQKAPAEEILKRLRGK